MNRLKRKPVRHVAAALFLLASLLPAAAVVAQVTVKQAPVEAKVRTFDPKRPPAEMPPLSGDEAAVTSSKFSCGVRVEVSITPGDAPVMTITGVTVEIGLSVVEWLPTAVSPKIRAHEAAHRQISEHYYSRAGEAAKRIAQKYVGRTFRVASTESADTTPVIRKAANEFSGEYFGATEVPAQKAQETFDRLTDHGRNDVPEKQAIRRSIASAAATGAAPATASAAAAAAAAGTTRPAAAPRR